MAVPPPGAATRAATVSGPRCGIAIVARYTPSSASLIRAALTGRMSCPSQVTSSVTGVEEVAVTTTRRPGGTRAELPTLRDPANSSSAGSSRSSRRSAPSNSASRSSGSMRSMTTDRYASCIGSSRTYHPPACPSSLTAMGSAGGWTVVGTCGTLTSRSAGIPSRPEVVNRRSSDQPRRGVTRSTSCARVLDSPAGTRVETASVLPGLESSARTPSSEPKEMSTKETILFPSLP